jgi:hypothetical protein
MILLAACHLVLLVSYFAYPEDGDNMLFRNFRISYNCTVFKSVSRNQPQTDNIVMEVHPV